MLLDGALLPAQTRKDMGSHALRLLASPRRLTLTGKLCAETMREALGKAKSRPKPKTKAGLTAVSPRRMWMWWDLERLDDVENIIAEASKPRPVLRFYDITGLPHGSTSWNQVFDVDAELGASGQSIDFWAADRTYIVDLGMVYADGRFLRLARSNSAVLPRENAGAPVSSVTRVTIAEPAPIQGTLTVDAAARAWFDAGNDWPTRDEEAELALRMVYRAFLEEGPRALKRLAPLVMKSRTELEVLYGNRLGRKAHQAFARRKAANAAVRRSANRVIVAYLDSRQPTLRPATRYPLQPAATVEARLGKYDFSLENADFFATLLRIAAAQSAPPQLLREDAAAAMPHITAAAQPETHHAADVSRFVKDVPVGVHDPYAWRAESIFAAARRIGRELSQMPVAVEAEQPIPATSVAFGASPDIGDSEGRRLGKAGIRLSRMALALEGRARPGARFKVGGKLVRADKDGRFRVECVLTGKKARIPLSGDSAAGGVKSVIALEWNKRLVREGKKRLFDSSDADKISGSVIGFALHRRGGSATIAALDKPRCGLLFVL